MLMPKVRQAYWTKQNLDRVVLELGLPPTPPMTNVYGELWGLVLYIWFM